MKKIKIDRPITLDMITGLINARRLIEAQIDAATKEYNQQKIKRSKK